MPIDIIQTAEPNRFVNPQIVHTKTGDGKELIVLSGIVLVHFKGNSEQNWLKENLRLYIDIRSVIPSGNFFFHEQSAPLVTLNAIYNRNVSNQAGYAVDSCRLFSSPQSSGGVTVECDIAVRDTDGWLYRVGYYITLVGTFGDRLPPEP